jgi:prepilin-type N-terminal cleavage/methylation domain-containing protein
MFKRAFTMIELIFVIVIMGILAKFGVQFLMNAYETYFFSTLQNRLQQQSEAAVTQLAARLQYRIKSSVVRSTGGTQLDWVGMDIDGWRGTWDGTTRYIPAWSGFIDLNTSTTPDSNFLSTPQTNTGTIDTIIKALSNNDSDINDAAIIFTGATDPTATIWDGLATTQTNELAHPIQASGTAGFASNISGVYFNDVDVYEFYKLAWTAYTVRLEGETLALYYNYQPWQNEAYSSGVANNVKRSILMENVQSFQYQTEGDLINIQVCVNDNNLTNPNNDVNGGFSVCKEKTVF